MNKQQKTSKINKDSRNNKVLPYVPCASLNGRDIKRWGGGGVNGLAIKEKVTFFTFFPPTGIKLEEGGGVRP